MADIEYTRWYKAKAKNPITWNNLLEIFDFIWSKDMRRLPHYPETIGTVHASWDDAKGAHHNLKTLDELEKPYISEKTAKIVIGSSSTNFECQLHYEPNTPSILLFVKSESEEFAEKIVQKVKHFFPIIDKFLFISYDTKDIKLAEVLTEIIEKRFSSDIKVFLAKRDIKPGQNPYKKMVEEQLLNAEVLLAICTPYSKNSHWLAWETSSVWTREKPVIPLYANITPTDFHGPISNLLQGRNMFEREELNDVIKELYKLIVPKKKKRIIDDDEWNKLIKHRNI